MAAYRKDSFDRKVDLGIGAYRDNNAKPWVLPVVKKVSRTTGPKTTVDSSRPMTSYAMIPI
jgi:aspartate/tyrosine/aromatic aminotransferase